MIELVYETHSISTDNEDGIASGWLDGRLSERGRTLAAELGRRRQGDGIAAVFASDLGRALETAEIAFARSEIPLFHDWRLRECDYGSWNGMPVRQLEAERFTRVDRPFPGGESYRDVVRRIESFLADLRRSWDGQRVLVISHAAPRFAFQTLIEGASLDELVAAPFAWQPGWEFRYY